ncbi:MAG: PEP-CTERM sorting domain-containing protein, partial [Verrucomicrobia bacterium]|nr:PEP-CTERM sorting domain-containing protein [Verrucomicrobiota bacterium]
TNGVPTLTGASVFSRAFNSGVIPTFYGEGGADLALTEQYPSPTSPDIVDMASSSDFILTTPIPEPGVGVLFLAGAAVAIFRRRRQQD